MPSCLGRWGDIPMHHTLQDYSKRFKPMWKQQANADKTMLQLHMQVILIETPTNSIRSSA